MADAHKNFAYSTVLTPPVTPTAGTALTLALGGGALMPATPFNATVWPTNSQPTTSNAEIVRVTGISGDIMTIVRSQESTSARSIGLGDQFSANITKKVFDDIEPYLNPIGTVNPYVGRTAPANWLLCDGSAVSRSTYAGLLNIIMPSVGTATITIASPGVFTLAGHGFQTGDTVYLTTTGALPTGLSANTIYYVVFLSSSTFSLATTYANALLPSSIVTTGSQSGTHTVFACPYGLGDGSTTFNVPDMRGRVPAGNNSMGGTGLSRLTLSATGGSAGNLGASGGEQAHVLTVAELASHNHSKATFYGTAGSSFSDATVWAQVNNNSQGSFTTPTGSAGSDAAHNNVQPTLVLNYIIKT